MSDYTQNVFFTAKDALSVGDAAKRIKGSEMDAELAEISTAIASKEDVANKGAASGYASLDASTLVPAAQLPAGTESAKGALELATTAEVVTGTDTARAVTPAGVEAWAAQNAGIVQDLANLADPGADRILFWDESANAAVALTVGSGLTITDTTLSADSQATTDASLLTSGTIPDARIQASGVTQHQASLSIAATQLTGSIADARVPSSNVTQHQASLAIVADQLTCAIRDVAGTTDSPTSTDEEDIITLSSASPTTVTLNSGVCAVGNSIAFIRLGAGTVTFAAGASQTVRSPGSRLTIPEQYGTAVATYIATNTWALVGV